MTERVGTQDVLDRRPDSFLCGSAVARLGRAADAHEVEEVRSLGLFAAEAGDPPPGAVGG